MDSTDVLAIWRVSLGEDGFDSGGICG